MFIKNANMLKKLSLMPLKRLKFVKSRALIIRASVRHTNNQTIHVFPANKSIFGENEFRIQNTLPTYKHSHISCSRTDRTKVDSPCPSGCGKKGTDYHWVHKLTGQSIAQGPLHRILPILIIQDKQHGQHIAKTFQNRSGNAIVASCLGLVQFFEQAPSVACAESNKILHL